MRDKILKIIAREFPLSFRPFQELGGKLGMGEEECLGWVKEVKSSGVVREIIGFFHSPAVGYETALVAFKVPPQSLDEIARLISRHPAVSHSHSREGEYNLWFTLHFPRERSLEEVSKLVYRSGVKDFLILPAIKRFKLAPPVLSEEILSFREVSYRKLSSLEIEAIKLLQQDLPLCPEPFQVLSSGKMAAQELIGIGRKLLSERIMRRYAARLNYYKVGFTENALICFEIPSEKVEEAANFLVLQPRISHCYLRKSYPHWRYNLYAMFNGADRSEAVFLAERVGFPYRVFFTVKEYKKEPVKYFRDEEV